jgi:hypothetical protein
LIGVYEILYLLKDFPQMSFGQLETYFKSFQILSIKAVEAVDELVRKTLGWVLNKIELKNRLEFQIISVFFLHCFQ